MGKLHLLTLASALLLAAPAARAQSADVPRGGSITGLKDPEPADPRYVAPSELANLKGQFLPKQEKAAERAFELDKVAPPQDTTPARALPNSSMSLRKP